MKFSIVTPSYNMEHWIGKTIESVISQSGTFEIEYIVVDGKSTDRTGAIVRSYQEKLAAGTFPIACTKVTLHLIEEKDSGMYAAINRGFLKATGDIYAWINADDYYAPGAFAVMNQCFSTYPRFQWIKGITGTATEDGLAETPGIAKIYHRKLLQSGVYGRESYYVEQDSVFWRSSLWKSAGPLQEKYRVASDYSLWIQFAWHTPLITVDAPISFFRKREGQLSRDISRYRNEQISIRPKRPLIAWVARFFFSPQSRLSSTLPFLSPVFRLIYSVAVLSYHPYYYIHYSPATLVLKRAYSFIITP